MEAAFTTHANRRILLLGGQGDARPIARGRAAVANAKIISFVDAEVKAVLQRARQELNDEHATARDRATHDLAFVADNLRNEIHSLTTTVIRLRHDHNALTNAVNQLRQDVDQLKQTGPKTNA